VVWILGVAGRAQVILSLLLLSSLANGVGQVARLLFMLALAAASLAVYFVPSIVAVTRGHWNRTAIFVLNLLLGWTFVGWGIALVWALTKDSRAK